MTGVQTCALPIWSGSGRTASHGAALPVPRIRGSGCPVRGCIPADPSGSGRRSRWGECLDLKQANGCG